jgi:hypothetical protein
MRDENGEPLCVFPETASIQPEVLTEAIDWVNYVESKTPPGPGGEDYSAEDFLLAGL